jgi:fructoselysine-6-P-deglycase FrlB-like protein
MEPVMTYSIFDTGNLVVSFDREDAAYEALERLAHEAPDAGDRLLLVAFDDEGNAVADCVPGARIAHAA